MEITVLTPLNRPYFDAFLPSSSGDRQAVSFGLILDGLACGCAQFSLHGQLARLVHIFVAPPCRRLGGGTYLLKESCHHLWRCGLSQLLCQPVYFPWETDSYLGLFLTSCGFQAQSPRIWVYTAPLSSFLRALSHGKHPQPAGNVVSLSHFPADRWSGLCATYPNQADVPQLQRLLSHPGLRADLSMITVENKALTGHLMVVQQEPQLLEIATLGYQGQDKTAVLRLLTMSLGQAIQLYPKDMRVTAMANHPKVSHMLETLLAKDSHSKCPVHHFTLHRKEASTPWD